MASVIRFASLLSLCSVALSRPQVSPLVVPDTPADVRDTYCGKVIVHSQQGYTLFWAYDVFECLRNVPFIDSVATRFLKYYNETLQFQSTLGYLKNPPEGYQQPPIDVVAELQKIQDKVDAGEYNSQYVFEADLQLLINRMHDAHVSLNAGATAPFAFVSPYGLVSASADGRKEPQVYLQIDAVTSRDQGWEPSPITEINGIDAVQYLTEFAALNSWGYLEPHADWNAVMESPVRDIQGLFSVLQSATFYPGDGLIFTFANGSRLETYWLATYHEPYFTGPITTAGDYYNYFVLGILPASYDEDEPDKKWWSDDQVVPSEEEGEGPVQEPTPDYGCEDGSPSEANWCGISKGAFPNNPAVAQVDLNVTGGGVASAYFLDDISTGVLSLPSFFQTGNDTANFFQVVSHFIGNATEKNTSKIIIDIQQNNGGLTLLALSTFKHFFYSLEPYTGSRIRSHEVANNLGKTYSAWWDGLEQTPDDDAAQANYWALASSDWVVTNRINDETGNNFTSWDDYYGPLLENGDRFSKTQLYNLSDTHFDTSAFQGYHPFGYGRSEPEAPPPSWSPESIVLLTDGLCSSACAYFVELMSQQAGVKTIAVGGRPTTGPMQAASGNRGARLYSAEALDYDILNVEEVIKDEEAFAQLPNRMDKGMWINFAGFNLRDQIREGDETRTPTQFLYEAADCRIYYTLDNVWNMTRLWYDAHAAMWLDPSHCVPDSTGYAAHGGNSRPEHPPPERTVQSPEVDFTTSLGSTNTPFLNISSATDLLNKATKVSITSQTITQCPARGSCKGSTKCHQMDVTCSSDHRIRKDLSACLLPCSNRGVSCPDNMKCVLTGEAESKNQLPGRTGMASFDKFEKVAVYNGFCKPIEVDTSKFPSLGCPPAPRT